MKAKALMLGRNRAQLEEEREAGLEPLRRRIRKRSGLLVVPLSR